jgi:hypothetical protein
VAGNVDEPQVCAPGEIDLEMLNYYAKKARLAAERRGARSIGARRFPFAHVRIFSAKVGCTGSILVPVIGYRSRADAAADQCARPNSHGL